MAVEDAAMSSEIEKIPCFVQRACPSLRESDSCLLTHKRMGIYTHLVDESYMSWGEHHLTLYL